MIHEKKALEKICPIISNGEEAENCVGSECMAWRWAFNQEGRGFCVLLSTQISIRNKKDDKNQI